MVHAYQFNVPHPLRIAPPVCEKNEFPDTIRIKDNFIAIVNTDVIVVGSPGVHKESLSGIKVHTC